MRSTTLGIGFVSLAFAVSASVLAQTSADTAAKKAPAVQTSESQAAMTPASALEKLKKGNARFVEKNMRSRDWLAKVSATAGGQYPFAVILACMDSRAPIEIIFDQGIASIQDTQEQLSWHLHFLPSPTRPTRSNRPSTR